MQDIMLCITLKNNLQINSNPTGISGHSNGLMTRLFMRSCVSYTRDRSVVREKRVTIRSDEQIMWDQVYLYLSEASQAIYLQSYGLSSMGPSSTCLYCRLLLASCWQSSTLQKDRSFLYHRILSSRALLEVIYYTYLLSTQQVFMIHEIYYRMYYKYMMDHAKISRNFGMSVKMQLANVS